MLEGAVLIRQGRAVIEIPMESEEIAVTIRSAIEPETNSAPSDRARAEVIVRGSVLVIQISSSDLTSLRAAMNSYIAWVSASLETIHAVLGQNP
ncbi:MAG: KEOPS complex subunit Pcc1 [Candidatus Thorarchaeota archaeon]